MLFLIYYSWLSVKNENSVSAKKANLLYTQAVMKINFIHQLLKSVNN